MTPGVGLRITDEPEWEQHVASVEQSEGQVKELAGREVVRRTEVKAPVDTGNLRDSYRMEKQSNGDVLVGTNVHYAPPQEFGGAFHTGQPHLRPSLDEVRRELAGIVGRVRGLLGTTPGGIL